MKTIIALIATVIISLNASAVTPGADMMFKTSLRLAAEKSWYDAEGNLLATSRMINEAALPFNVIKSLMKKCPDYQIRFIREFEAEGINTYVITLENEKGYKVVRCLDKTLTVLQQLEKC
ncbi:hypothetical protein WJU16_09420 [Chitinophaga pollutisoli]|uniref:Uncharacterized protein n=1 Tax=Chitinophaga pollutisoli TaxID=3133966 RepID=A0ABZ2YVG5_9BACT